MFEVELIGSQFLVENFDSSGIALNISRSGMLAEVDRLLAVGTDCVVSIVQGDELVEPREVKGHVRRSSMGRAGWVIGIEFDSLVDVRDRHRDTKRPPRARPA